MNSEQSKAFFRRIPEEVFNQGHLAVADEIFAPDYIEHAPLPIPPGSSSRESFKQFVTMVRSAFPDFHYTVEDEIAEGDQVVTRLTARGTQQGAFLGMPPSGKVATWSEIHISRMADSQLAEHWVVIDQLGMLQQLGAIPAPGQ